jgi:CheY-like chemotaxis protein
MSGYQAIAAIRERPQYADLPIIAVTAKVVDGERDRCLGAGASDYVTKPVHSSELVAALEPWLPEVPRATAAIVGAP